MYYIGGGGVSHLSPSHINTIGQFAVRNLLDGPKNLNKTPINLEDLDVDFGLQHFKLCLFVNEGDEETNS